MEKLVIGTRGSALALVQAEMTEQLLQSAFPQLKLERKIITTTGDRRTDVALSQVAKVEGVTDKGVFTKELELALDAEEIDIAVHSLKDVPTLLPEGFEIAAVLPRASVADVLISKQEGGLNALKKGATVATSSVRRQRMIQWLRPDLQCCDIRGNVPTRLKKLAASHSIDAIILADAGLTRLGYDATGKISTEAGDVYGTILDQSEFLPAAGQGAVGIEIKKKNTKAAQFLQKINDDATFTRITAERTFLHLLDAGCHTPVGVASQLLGDKILLEAIVFDEEGHQEPKTAEIAGERSEPKKAAQHLYKSLA